MGNWRSESSNYQEADNLVTSLEAWVAEGKLLGHELFMFMDIWSLSFAIIRDMSAPKNL